MLLVLKPVPFEQDPKHLQIETSVRLRKPELREFRPGGCFDMLVNIFARLNTSPLGTIELCFQSLAQGASHNQNGSFRRNLLNMFQSVVIPSQSLVR